MLEELEKIFRSFENDSGWQLSLPAKVIIQQGMLSIWIDTLGMGGISSEEERFKTARRAIDTLKVFLEHLASVAEPLAKEAEAKGLKNHKTIGGILVLQNSKAFGSMFECSCWPEG